MNSNGRSCQAGDRCYGGEQYKDSPVSNADAVVDELTVVVESHHAGVTLGAMVRTTFNHLSITNCTIIQNTKLMSPCKSCTAKSQINEGCVR